MGEYKSSFVVLLLLFVAIVVVTYSFFFKNKTNIDSPNNIDNYNSQIFNYENDQTSYNEYENNATSYNDYVTNNSSLDNSELSNNIDEETIKASDVTESVQPTKKVSKFDIDFTRTNEKEEPDITQYNALKLRSLGWRRLR